MSKKTLPDIATNLPEWFNTVIFEAQLADLAPVKGCMVIRPYGHAIWELIRDELDRKIKKTGHQNAAFPLLIPESFLKREADHVAGFSPELAVVTHAGGKQLEEPLVVRPTSETIIHYMFAQWLRSWRDLPIKINQWASVVRWEMRTRPFLRTTEFWWQEGHTAHETAEEADAEARMMLEEYRDLAENFLAIPVVTGEKTPTEKFAGADVTLTFEGLMPDGKALQMGTSHRISQTFAHAFEMKFQDRTGKESYPHLTSWGATTRLVGALIMTHGDQKGLVLPPMVAPTQVVIIPIYKGEETVAVGQSAAHLERELSATCRVALDAREDETPGAKFYHYELRGVPVRIELGPRDLSNGTVTVVERHTGLKKSVARTDIASYIADLLPRIQKELFDKAAQRRAQQWHHAETAQDIAARIEHERGFYETGWCGKRECELRAKEFKATTRCIVPTHHKKHCYACGEASIHDILIAMSY